jgi:uncharacterized protein (TIGR03067 family)
MSFTALLGVTSFLVSAGPLPKGSDGGLGYLRGEWQLLSTSDARRIDRGSEFARMVIHGDGRVVFRAGETVTNRGTVKFGVSEGLRTIDLALAGGEVLLGVYEVDGERLTICFAPAGERRPASVTPAGRQWAERWKRSSL